MLEIRSLQKRFGGVQATNLSTLRVEAGTITALIGPNGSGKTTLFNQLSGLIKPDSGQIWLDGKQIDGLSPHKIARSGVARTFQLTRLFPSLTLMENMVLAAHDRMPQPAARARELLAFVGLEEKREELAGELSYGQRKLLEFARALVNRPRLVLLDEPFAGVNPVLEEKMVEHIQAMNKQGVTFFLIDHEMKIIMEICHPILVMDGGELIAQGTAAEVQANEAVMEAYFGR
jgi:ABC-type branched-subunit amino acid transport system ATPase component